MLKSYEQCPAIQGVNPQNEADCEPSKYSKQCMQMSSCMLCSSTKIHGPPSSTSSNHSPVSSFPYGSNTSANIVICPIRISMFFMLVSSKFILLFCSTNSLSNFWYEFKIASIFFIIPSTTF